MTKITSSIKVSRRDRAFDIFLYMILTLLALLTLYPFWNVFVLALNEPLDTLRGGVYFWPRAFTLNNLKQILQMSNLLKAFTNSILRTVIGAAVSVFDSAENSGYPCSAKYYLDAFEGVHMGWTARCRETPAFTPYQRECLRQMKLLADSLLPA